MQLSAAISGKLAETLEKELKNAELAVTKAKIENYKPIYE